MPVRTHAWWCAFGDRTFARARAIPRSAAAIIPKVGLAQSAGGHVVAVWHDGVRDRMLASASRTGRRWTRARVLAGHVPVPAGVRVALGPDGRGVVVWDENTGDRIHGAPALLRQ